MLISPTIYNMVAVAVPFTGVRASPLIKGPSPRSVRVRPQGKSVLVDIICTVSVLVITHRVLVVVLGVMESVGPVGLTVVPLQVP